MKRNNKIILMGVIGLALLSGCTKGYKEGIYTGTAIDSYGGQNNTATAIVTVDKNGKITDVDLDTTYTKDGVETTKKKLGDSYGMYGGEYGSQVGEWYQQVETLEKNVSEESKKSSSKEDDEINEEIDKNKLEN